MERRALARPSVITLVLVLQFIPLVLFPPESFSPSSQEWWLPVILAVLTLVSSIELVFRHSSKTWPWDLMSFSQGFNIISRIMMVWAHSTVPVAGTLVLNTSYLVLTSASMVLSAALLWYTGLPDVRTGLIK